MSVRFEKDVFQKRNSALFPSKNPVEITAGHVFNQKRHNSLLLTIVPPCRPCPSPLHRRCGSVQWLRACIQWSADGLPRRQSNKFTYASLLSARIGYEVALCLKLFSPPYYSFSTSCSRMCLQATWVYSELLFERLTHLYFLVTNSCEHNGLFGLCVS